jgi:hypothetical protein
MTAAMESIESVDRSKGNILQNVDPQALQETEGNVLQTGLQETELQTDRPKSIIQQIDYAVNSSQIDLCSLEFISELLLEHGKKVESSCIGGILEDYIGKLRESLEKVEVLACDLGRQINE